MDSDSAHHRHPTVIYEPSCLHHSYLQKEKGAAPKTVRHIAGHVSEQMMKHYSHNRHEAQMAVLEAMDSTPKPKRKRTAARESPAATIHV
jgi:hypothetical protein